MSVGLIPAVAARQSRRALLQHHPGGRWQLSAGLEGLVPTLLRPSKDQPTMPPSNPVPSCTNGGSVVDLPCGESLERQKTAKGWHWLTTALMACTWLYVAGVLIVWLLLRLAGDRWWLATVMLFGPRWVYGLPLLLLVPAAAVLRRRLLVPLAVSTIVLVGPIAGLRLPWVRLFAPAGAAVRILTCNVKGQCTNNDVLDKLINTAEPDIVALQGCWGDVRIRWPAGWHVLQVTDFVVASRYPLVRNGTDHGWRRPGHWPRIDMAHCTVQVPEREIDLCSVHLLSPHGGIEAVIDRQTVLRPSKGPVLAAEIEQRSQDSEDAARYVGQLSPTAVLAGDFNMPIDSGIYRRDWAGYRNAFSDAGLGFGYTEWRKVRGFSWGVRIDHVLTGSSWRCRACWVGPDIGSDHLPVLADLVWDLPCDER
jgi:vancomycin resistance protein VanJ